MFGLEDDLLWEIDKLKEKVKELENNMETIENVAVGNVCIVFDGEIDSIHNASIRVIDEIDMAAEYSYGTSSGWYQNAIALMPWQIEVLKEYEMFRGE